MGDLYRHSLDLCIHLLMDFLFCDLLVRKEGPAPTNDLDKLLRLSAVLFSYTAWWLTAQINVDFLWKPTWFRARISTNITRLLGCLRRCVCFHWVMVYLLERVVGRNSVSHIIIRILFVSFLIYSVWVFN